MKEKLKNLAKQFQETEERCDDHCSDDLIDIGREMADIILGE